MPIVSTPKLKLPNPDRRAYLDYMPRFRHPRHSSTVRTRRPAALVYDEEALPFAPMAFDLVVSCGSLHLVNDLPGALVQMRHILRPGGLLLAAFPGGSTLTELRHAWLDAEAGRTGGVSPRIAPFADLGLGRSPKRAYRGPGRGDDRRDPRPPGP